MTAIVFGVLVVLVLLGLLASRLLNARTERRSMENYGHALGVLGDVTRRSEGSANVRVLPHDAGSAHVRTANTGEFPTAVSPTGETEILQPGTPQFQVSPKRPDEADIVSAEFVDFAAEAGPEAEIRARPPGFRPHSTAWARPPGTRPTTSIPEGERELTFEDDSQWSAPGPMEDVGAAGVTGEAAARAAGAADELADEVSGHEAWADEAAGEAWADEASAHDERPADETIAIPAVGAGVAHAAGESALSFGTDDGLGRDDTGSPVHEPGTGGGERRRVRTTRVLSVDELRRQATHRRIGTAAAAAVAVVALVLAGLQLTKGPTRSAGGGSPTTTSAHTHSSQPPTSSTAPKTPTTTTPKLLVPTSTTSSIVSFNAPSGSYQLSFDDSGLADCWIGVKSSANSTTWLWMSTLTPGETESYTADGPIAVDLGAPANLAVKVNGVQAQLPNYSLPYYLAFNATTASSGSA